MRLSSYRYGMGAYRVGSVPSTVAPNRHLPLLAFPLAPAGVQA